MKYFSPQFIKFFQELRKNNNKEWFHMNKNTYESEVKIPFRNFVTDLIKEVGLDQTNPILQAKDCVSRINRDIRFSKDKTPYNDHLNAFVSKGGRKNKAIPGLYVRVSPDMIGVMGGSYAPDKQQLSNIRHAIAKDNTFDDLIHSSEFETMFGAIRGEAIKRIPKELQSAHAKQPLVANKSFYYMTELPKELITQDNLLEEIMKCYKVLLPVNSFLTRAIMVD